jgi:hypothetical protein
VTRRYRANALVFLGYAAAAFFYLGARIAAHPGRYLIGYGRDPQIFVWSFAWWPHAIGNWQNPIISRAVYAPEGINLAWATTVPALSLAFTPITLLFGPVASYNVAAILMPAASAWTAYLLCRHLTRRLWPALVGGYLYGFSSYMIGQTEGHVHMTSIFLLPLIALAVVRYLQEEIGGRGLAWRLGALYGIQFALSTEVFFTAALMLAAGLVLAYVLAAPARPRLRAAFIPLLSGAAIAAVIASPLIYYALTGFQRQSINSPDAYNGDLLNFVVPTHLIAIGGSALRHLSGRFRGNDAERGAYIGLPTLAIACWYFVDASRSAVRRFLLAALAVAVLLTLGTELVVEGSSVFPLPWKEIAGRPLFNNVLPARFAAYVSLTAAVIVAFWTASRRGVLSWALPALAVAALVPAFWLPDFRSHPERWPFFTTSAYKGCIPKNENVAIFPFGYKDDSMLWQAESGFWFRMPEGYLAPDPPAANIDHDPVIQMLSYTLADPTPDQIVGLVQRKKIDRIVSVVIYVHPNGTEMHRFGQVQFIGGVSIAPACGYPSLQKGIEPSPPYAK